MAYENFTLYTEVDDDGDITVTESQITVDTMRRDAVSYVRKDYGAGYFTNFLVKVQVKLTACDAGAGHILWAMSNGSNTVIDQNSNSDGIRIYMHELAGNYYIQLSEGGGNSDNWNGAALNTWYYLTIYKIDTSLTCKIYSDSTRRTLVDTLTITCTDTTYQYIYGLCSYDYDVSPDITASSITGMLLFSIIEDMNDVEIRLAFLGDNGGTYEAIPFSETYPTGAVSLTEDTSGQAEDLARFTATVNTDFDEKGICQIYKGGVFVRYLIFDHEKFHKWQAQGGYTVYRWKYVQFADSGAEQSMVTGTDQLSLIKLDSGQASLPTFAGTVVVRLHTSYQARTGYISTQPSINAGNVEFGVTLNSGSGVAYFDVDVIQINN